MPRQEVKQIAVQVPIYQKLKARKHAGQSLPGVIEELLELADRYSPLPKAPEPTQTPPKPRDPTLLDGDHRIEPLTIIDTANTGEVK